MAVLSTRLASGSLGARTRADPHQPVRLSRGQRPSEQVALGFEATEFRQGHALLLRFDTFRRRRDSQCVRNVDHGAYHGRGMRHRSHPQDEAAVNLDLVERKALQFDMGSCVDGARVARGF